MSALKHFVLILLLCLFPDVLASEVVSTLAPTSSPTAALDDETTAPPASSTEVPPASSTEAAPTSAPSGSPTDSQDGEDDHDHDHDHDHSSSTTQAESSVAPATPVTTFTAGLKVASAADFDGEAYLKTIAESTGVPNDNVKVKSIDYVISVSYSFADTVTEDEVKQGAASMAGVEAENVKVALTTTGRRLRQLEAAGRRLQAVTADVEITTKDSTAADTISGLAAQPDKLTEGIQAATGKVVAAPTVTAAPAMEVQVVTEVTSESDAPVTLPDATQIASKMEEKTGKTFTVTVSDPVITGGSSTSSSPTVTTEIKESSDARKQTTSSIVGIFLVLTAQAFIFSG